MAVREGFESSRESLNSYFSELPKEVQERLNYNPAKPQPPRVRINYR